MSREEETLPKKRRKYLVVQRLAGETLVYDWIGHKGVCLNPTSSLIWKHCNGRTTVYEMARILERELSIPPDPDVVRYGVQRLRDSNLLYEPKPNGGPGLTRREVLHRVAAASIPVVASLAMPFAASAITLITPTECQTKCQCDPECLGFTQCQAGSGGPSGKFCCPNSADLTVSQNCNCNAPTAAGCREVRLVGRPACCDFTVNPCTQRCT